MFFPAESDPLRIPLFAHVFAGFAGLAQRMKGSI